MLKVENLSVGYEKRIVVDDINITVSAGDIVTLIGPNGAGKSTILKTITRQLERLGGTVYIDGKDMSVMNDADVSKLISMVTTERISPELMSCREIVATGRYPYTGRFGLLTDEDNRIIDESMELFDALQIMDIPFAKISDGQRQRVMLARAVCQQPQVLILDEPTSFLDIKYKLEIMSCLLKLVKEKDIAVIMSLHELELAKAVSDQVVCVSDGHITRQGSVDDIFGDGYIKELYDMDDSRIADTLKSVYAY